MKLAERIGRVGASPTLAISEKAKALQRQGVDVVDFGAGEPDFDTPEAIKEACRQAMADGKTKYSPASGEVELREAIAKQAHEKWGLSYTIDQIVVSGGAKQSLFNLFAALLSSGDEVIVIAPHWVSYPPQVLLADGKPVVVETTPEQNFCPSIDALDAAVTDRTRAIVFNSPSNPTGATWTHDELTGIGDWLLRHPGVTAIYDGIYSELIFGVRKYYELAAIHPDLAEQVVCVNGVSKSYAMTGWRIGWAMGPKDLMKGAGKFQSQTTSGPNTMAQWAALASFSLDPSIMENMRQTYEDRCKLTCDLLLEIPHVKLRRPGGALYAFPDLNAYIGGASPEGVLTDDVALASYLLEEVGVALVPGSAFGAPGFIRITYACDDATIEKGVSRIAEALAKVKI